MAFTGPKWPLTLPISSMKICTRIGNGQDAVGWHLTSFHSSLALAPAPTQ